MFGENIFQIFSKLAIFFQIILGVYIYIWLYYFSKSYKVGDTLSKIILGVYCWR